MTIWTWSLIFLVGILNIGLNFQAQRTAFAAESWITGIRSANFVYLFIVGCCSLLSLYTLYTQKVLLARGILLMGAVSIVGGTLFGVLYRGQDLDLVEWLLLGGIAVLFTYRLLPSG